MIRFSCPACKSKLSAPEEKAGVKLPCPKCGQKLQIPAAPASTPTNMTMMGELEPSKAPAKNLAAPMAAEPMTVLPAEMPVGTQEPKFIAQTAKGSDDDVGEGWVTLQVSARVLKWPNRCACCGSRPDTVLTVSHTRTEGIKVIRSDTRTWDVPYCTRCLTHVRTYERCYQMRKDAEQATEEAGRVGSSSVLLVMAILSTVLAATCVVTSVMGLILSAAERADRPGGSGAASGLICVLFFGGLATLFFFLHRNEQRNALAMRTAARAQADNLHRDAENIFSQAKATMAPSCPLIFQAVLYRGWQGTVHTFLFRNQEYAQAFAEANSSKLLS